MASYPILLFPFYSARRLYNGAFGLVSNDLASVHLAGGGGGGGTFSYFFPRVTNELGG